MQLFYVPDAESGFSITGDEAKHLAKVLRKKIGDSIIVTDGKGKGFEAIINSIIPNEVIGTVSNEIFSKNELAIKVHLAVAPTKNSDRFEWMVEKATELGVHEITPVICERSERKTINIQRLEKIALAAMKQSGRFYLPKIHEAVLLKNFSPAENEKFIAHCLEKEKKELSSFDFKKSVVVLIGPEGDFAPNEIEMCLKKNYVPVALGASRLRTETAGVYVMSVMRTKG
jgi:16S rRNA (uracil1498-N3)-methyltransferase